MSFRFEHPDLPIDDNARRAAKAEFDRAIAEVTETGFEVHETVRNVRRRLKRVRSIIKLIRPVFRDYAEENARLGGMGAEVSALRDAAALVETADWLVLATEDHAAIEALERVRRKLADRAVARESELDREAFLTGLRTQLREARVRSELWELSGTGRRAVVPGFVRSYHKARAAARLAADTRKPEHLHEWRKRVKCHWSQLGLLRGFAPEFAEIRRERMGKLAELLGAHQNYCVLLRALDDVTLVDGDDHQLLTGLVESELDRLCRKSLKLGQPLFRDEPAIIERRWRNYFADWRAIEQLRTPA